MKKKVLSLALCLAMLAALTAPASAASTEWKVAVRLQTE